MRFFCFAILVFSSTSTAVADSYVYLSIASEKKIAVYQMNEKTGMLRHRHDVRVDGERVRSSHQTQGDRGDRLSPRFSLGDGKVQPEISNRQNVDLKLTLQFKGFRHQVGRSAGTPTPGHL